MEKVKHQIDDKPKSAANNIHCKENYDYQSILASWRRMGLCHYETSFELHTVMQMIA
jgi:hypothetical protein